MVEPGESCQERAQVALRLLPAARFARGWGANSSGWQGHRQLRRQLPARVGHIHLVEVVKVELKRQGMALFLNGRALCRGLIPLSGPRGTLRKQSLRRTYLFLLGISLCHKYESCSEVPTAAHSSALLFGRQHVRVAAEANPQHDRIHWLYIHWFSQYLVLSNYEAMFSNSYCDSTCIGPAAGVRHPVCATPEDGFRVPDKKTLSHH